MKILNLMIFKKDSNLLSFLRPYAGRFLRDAEDGIPYNWLIIHFAGALRRLKQPTHVLKGEGRLKGKIYPEGYKL